MKSKKIEFGRKILEFLFLLVFLFTMALLVECAVFQFKSLWIKEDPVVVDLMSEDVEVVTEEKLAKLSREEQESIRINQENQKMIAEYNGLEYVDDMSKNYASQYGTTLHCAPHNVLHQTAC